LLNVPTPPSQFDGVSVVAKANVYFDGGVVSHTLLVPGGGKKTLGLIRAGSYHFNTEAPEIMEIIDGACSVAVDGSNKPIYYGAGTKFEVPGKSGFRIDVAQGICQYICSFLR
jgi:purine/pyrimidine-nucleoside phosphorylase